MRPRSRAVAWLIAGLVAVLPVQAHGAPCPTDLCAPTANPCRVAQSCEVERAATIDLGGRDLVIAAGVTVTAVETPLALTAGSVALEAGAVLIAPDHKARGGGRVTITTAAGIRVGPDARVDVSGEFIGGALTFAAAGDVTIEGALDARAARFGVGGFITITTSTGSIALSGSSRVTTSSGGPGLGGPLMMSAPLGRIAIDGTIDMRAGTLAGPIIGSAGGDITVSAGARLILDGTSADADRVGPVMFGGTGGDVQLDSREGDVTLEGALTATGIGNAQLDAGGEGGTVDIIALAGNVLLGGPIDLSGFPPGSGGFGGDLSALAGGSITQRGKITASSSGEFSSGGRVDFTAGDSLTLGDIDVSAEEFGGSIDGEASQAIVLVGSARLNADCPGGGGDVFMQARTVGIEGTITSRAPWREDGVGGLVAIEACDVRLPTRAQISVSGRGGGGVVDLHAGGSLTLGGRVRAGGDQGQIVVGHGFLPAPVIRRFRPRPLLFHEPNTRLCVPSQPTTTTTSTIITTTSTTAASETSSSTTTTTTTTPATVSSTTSPTNITISTTTTTPTGAPSRTPPTLPGCTADGSSACDDGDPCTVDRCSDGACTHDAVGDFEQVVCRLEIVRALLAAHDGTTGHAEARLERRIVRVSTLVEAAANARGRRASVTIGRAVRALRAFRRAVERNRTLDLARRQRVMRTAGDALRRLPALARRATSARRGS